MFFSHFLFSLPLTEFLHCPFKVSTSRLRYAVSLSPAALIPLARSPRIVIASQKERPEACADQKGEGTVMTLRSGPWHYHSKSNAVGDSTQLLAVVMMVECGEVPTRKLEPLMRTMLWRFIAS